MGTMPKTRSGKIIRRVLKAMASGQTLGGLSTLEDEASVEEGKKAFEKLTKLSPDSSPELSTTPLGSDSSIVK